MAYITVYYKAKSGYINEQQREMEIEAVVECQDVIASIRTINEKGLFDLQRGVWIPPHKISKITFDRNDYRFAKGEKIEVEADGYQTDEEKREIF